MKPSANVMLLFQNPCTKHSNFFIRQHSSFIQKYNECPLFIKLLVGVYCSIHYALNERAVYSMQKNVPTIWNE